MPITIIKVETGYRVFIRCDICGAAIDAAGNVFFAQGPIGPDEPGNHLDGPYFAHKGCDEHRDHPWKDWPWEELAVWLGHLVANTGVDRARFEIAAWEQPRFRFDDGTDTPTD